MNSWKMQSVLITTSDQTTLKAVEKLFPSDRFTITSDDSSNIDGLNRLGNLAKSDLDCIKKARYPELFDYYISTRSVAGSSFMCVILIEHKGILVSTRSFEHLNANERSKDIEYTCLVSQIASALSILSSKMNLVRELIGKYKIYADYPKPGVSFQDFFSLIREASNIEKLYGLLEEQYTYDNFDYIAGPESRGFFGFGLCLKLNVGFIPLRKKGKLPGMVSSITYGTEYSTDTLEAPEDIKPGSRVLIFDDLIATGGSLKAACDLLERAGCTIVDCVVLREVPALRSKAMATLGRPYKVLLQD